MMGSSGLGWARRSSRDFQLRTQMRFAAEQAGVNLSNVWNAADTARRLARFGGTLDSTQSLYRLFRTVATFSNVIDMVVQDIATPQGNPFPREFPVGYQPTSTNALGGTARGAGAR